MAASRTSAQLKKYRSMRDFKKTREPAGAERTKKSGKLRYLIQKHAATRLHYDFRLEMNGVLKSWAVTRGPSLDPVDKRLAVHVEDHPFEYGDFEGTIPKGEYGGGTVMLWDTGTWEPMGDAEKDYAKGKLHFRLHGSRLKGEWVLLKMRGRASTEKRENWLLIKVDDKEAKKGDGDYALTKHITSVTTMRSMDKIAKGTDVWHSNKTQKKEKARPAKTVAKPIKKAARKSSMPEKVTLQLATLVDKAPVGKEWVHEIKFDGYRLLARITDGNVRLLTRNGNDWTRKFQIIADQLATLKIDNALIDGEVVAVDENDRMNFHTLQNDLSENHQQRMHYYAFDLLYLNGVDLTRSTLLERKDFLKQIIPAKQQRLHYSEHFTESGGKVLQNACSIALEGIISKRADSPYAAGRGTAWLKVKCTHEQEFVIGGYTEQREHPGVLGALLIGYYKDGKLHFGGKVGTGFTVDEGRELLRQLKKIKAAKSAFANAVPAHQRRGALWLKPELVAQISFSEWTPSGSLRHPVYHGLRKDKPAKDIKREVEKHTATVTQKETAAKASPAGKTIKKPARVSQSNTSFGNVTLTHPERILFKDISLTKTDLAEYYQAVAPLMLPHVAGRPVSLMRCPEGSGEACFFQRHASAGMPPGLREVNLDSKREKYLTIDDIDGLYALVQMSSLEVHVWGAEADDVDRPDRIVLDFDPDEGVSWNEVKKAVLDMRHMLDTLKLKSFIKTTGGKGLHIVIPFAKGPDWPKVKSFSHALCQLLQQQYPDRFTTNSRKAVRKGKIYLDYLRNDRTSSAVAPYSVRAREGAPVAMPIDWAGLATLKSSRQYTVKNTPAYLKKRKKDPWAEMKKIKQKLPQIS